MTDQSAQLQALEQALQDKGIGYEIKQSDEQSKHVLGQGTYQKTTITVEVYDTGE